MNKNKTGNRPLTKNQIEVLRALRANHRHKYGVVFQRADIYGNGSTIRSLYLRGLLSGAWFAHKPTSSGHVPPGGNARFLYWVTDLGRKYLCNIKGSR